MTCAREVREARVRQASVNGSSLNQKEWLSLLSGSDLDGHCQPTNLTRRHRGWCRGELKRHGSRVIQCHRLNGLGQECEPPSGGDPVNEKYDGSRLIALRESAHNRCQLSLRLLKDRYVRRFGYDRRQEGLVKKQCLEARRVGGCACKHDPGSVRGGDCVDGTIHDR